MLTKHLAMAISVSALGGCATLAEPASEPITKLELRSLRSGPATDLVLDQLSDALIFEQPPLDRAHPPQHALSDAFFYMRPHAVHYSALCRSDQLIVLFEPSNRSNQGASTPVHAVGVEAAQRFHFLSIPSTGTGYGYIEVIPDDQTARCAAMDPEDDSFFFADNEREAWIAGALLALVQQQVRTGNSSQELVCNLETDCRTAILEVDAARPNIVQRCVVPGYAGECTQVYIEGIVITIQGAMRGGANEALRWQIDRIQVNESLTIADRALD